MELAPIVLFVYNRPWHTRQTLEALQKNTLAHQSLLYIYADGPKKDANEEILKNIAETRAIIGEKQWCKEVYIIEANANKGLAASVISGVTEVVNKYGKVIVLEDDIVTSTVFLQFMNDALQLYEHEKKVFGVAGFTFPVVEELPDTFFLQMTSSWGWATWKRSWQYFEADSAKLLNYFQWLNFKFHSRIKKFNVGGYPYYQMLQQQSLGKINSWAIRFYATLFRHQAFFLYPGKSLCINIGFDNSGTHCGVDDFFTIHKLNDFYKSQTKLDVKESIVARKAVENYLSNYN